MDFKKSFNASKTPILYLVILGIISVVLGAVLPGLVGVVVGFAIFLLSLIIYLWTGYHSVKRFKMDLGGAVLTGAITGFISSLINGIISLIYVAFNLSRSAAGVGEASLIGGIILGIVLLVVGVVFWAVAGAVLAVIGGFIAGRP